MAFRSSPTYFRCLAWVQNVCKSYQQTTQGTSTNTQLEIMHTIVIHMITLFCIKMKTKTITATTIHNITHKGKVEPYRLMKQSNTILNYQSPIILTELLQHYLINVSYLTACYLYQVMVNLQEH